ncbi:hypothetical protein HQ590_07130, partial [bacterium]|nr:hypothetical protein [bacterium]
MAVETPHEPKPTPSDELLEWLEKMRGYVACALEEGDADQDARWVSSNLRDQL